jgi:hypothetical protein
MTRPLRSTRVTGLPRYYETVRPRAPRRYSASCGVDRLRISLSPSAHWAGDSIGATGSHVPCKSPGQTRAAYMPDAIWAVGRLPPDLSRSPALAPVSTPLKFLTTRHQRFALARLPDPHLTRSRRAFSRSAHHERHLTAAACGGLGPPPAERPRRTYLHLLHSTASRSSYIDASFSVRGTRTAETRRPSARLRPGPPENRPHSGIGLHTPASVHFGTAEQIRTQRAATLQAAYAATPDRFHTKPIPPRIPAKAWINDPARREKMTQNN